MSRIDPPRQPQAFELWREAQDTRMRTRLGGIYYLLAWLLTWLFSVAPSTQLHLGLAGCVLFALLLLLRLRHRLPSDDTPQALRVWLDRHWILILLTALAWGMTHAHTLNNPAYASSWIIATLSTIAFSTALAFNFSMRKGRAIVALLLLYLPGLAALALHWEEQRATLITLAFYLSYLILALNRSHREYRNTLALELKLLEQQESLEVLSRTDSLTQLGNRYQFNSLFPVMIANAQRQSDPLSLVLLDIDFFKRVNDEHGHACGDACLSAFAERMRQVFRRDSDALLRLGGEEFGVLMPNTPLDQARLLAESFREELATHGFKVKEHHLPLTASLGVGCFDRHRDDSAEAFFKRVDDALYLAKSAGRNRLVLA
ncbi:GGDEF domain-containing protein [Pseudomonas sp. UBA2684]|uniref:GGDEF domain-containing protein n=1 Tax=Pseudomonas sp. UBA2684 TaxID=1947311 RepID=UPI000E99B374|nr:GGDEF domain-containing protein [Pseudomonas sp. UBA2684]HBX57741.1 GGDEF domain-containing protein [Pseudomonas sp.]|tara:strand:- start:36266 stop:37387 length:1122 start_codon:yes stop_codon:yes gene_type:complete